MMRATKHHTVRMKKRKVDMQKSANMPWMFDTLSSRCNLEVGGVTTHRGQRVQLEGERVVIVGSITAIRRVLSSRCMHKDQ